MSLVARKRGANNVAVLKVRMELRMEFSFRSQVPCWRASIAITSRRARPAGDNLAPLPITATCRPLPSSRRRRRRRRINLRCGTRVRIHGGFVAGLVRRRTSAAEILRRHVAVTAPPRAPATRARRRHSRITSTHATLGAATVLMVCLHCSLRVGWRGNIRACGSPPTGSVPGKWPRVAAAQSFSVLRDSNTCRPTRFHSTSPLSLRFVSIYLKKGI